MKMTRNRIFPKIVFFVDMKMKKQYALGSITQGAINKTIYKQVFSDNFLCEILN